MQVDELIRQWAAWLNDPAVKATLLFAGGFMLRAWGPFVNKAIPTALLAVSSLLSTLRLLFPSMVPPDSAGAMFLPALYMTAGPGGATGPGFIVDTLIPLAGAIACQSGVKNTGQWLALIRAGVGFLWPPHPQDGKRRPR